MKNHRFKIAPCIYRQLIYGRAIIAGMYGNNALHNKFFWDKWYPQKEKLKSFSQHIAKLNSKMIKCLNATFKLLTIL